jgi:hypothetical protein
MAILFAGGGGLPLENNDEPAHTFIDVRLVQRALASGVLLKIDLGQNFGTPLLGDPVVCPFAPHAATYAVLPPPRAMLVNIFLMAVLTTAALTAFYADFFTLPIASVCAVLAFTTPSFLYFIHHHPHQGALLYFTLLLLAVRRFLGAPSRPRAVAVAAATLVFCLGVGANGVLMGVIVAAAFTALARNYARSTRVTTLVLMALAIIAVAPHFLEFARLAAASARAHVNYQTLLFNASPRNVLADLLLLLPTALTSGETVHYSPAVLVLAAWGLLAARERADVRWQIWLLGWVPLVAVLLIRMFPSVAGALPLVRASNVTRILWFSTPFLMLSVGAALSLLPTYGFVRRHRVLVAVLLLVAFTPQIPPLWWQLRPFHSSERDLGFRPPLFLSVMERGSRLATDLDPVPWNFDIKAIPHGILASTGRSILMDESFRASLAARGLITTGWYGLTYAFLPASPAALARFGVRYFGTRDRALELVQNGWKPLAAAEGFYLFESPLRPSLVFIDGPAPQFLTAAISGNDLSVLLPADRDNYTLVATFVALPGWHASIDGEPVHIDRRADGLMGIRIKNGRRLSVRYEPFSNVMIAIAFAVAATGVVAVALAGVPRCRPAPSMVADRA